MIWSKGFIGNSRVIQRYRGSLGVGSTRAFSDDSFIWLASATKIVTTTAVLIASQMGLLSLQDSVAVYLPELTDLDILIGFEEVPNGKGIYNSYIQGDKLLLTSF